MTFLAPRNQVMSNRRDRSISPARRVINTTRPSHTASSSARVIMVGRGDSGVSKMLPRKWGDEGHGLGEPAPALEPPRNGDDARNMGNVAVLENHPLRDQILEWQRLADQAKKKHEARHRSEPPHSGPQKLTPPSPPPRQE